LLNSLACCLLLSWCSKKKKKGARPFCFLNWAWGAELSVCARALCLPRSQLTPFFPCWSLAGCGWAALLCTQAPSLSGFLLASAFAKPVAGCCLSFLQSLEPPILHFHSAGDTACLRGLSRPSPNPYLRPEAGKEFHRESPMLAWRPVLVSKRAGFAHIQHLKLLLGDHDFIFVIDNTHDTAIISFCLVS
jgi:hypothetical protein